MSIKNVDRIEHIYEESIKHSIHYNDLLHATLCVRAKYRGKFDEERFHSESVVYPNDKLWHEAYYCALALKKQRMEIWLYHTPRLKDLGFPEPDNFDYQHQLYWQNQEKEAQLLADRYNYYQ